LQHDAELWLLFKEFAYKGTLTKQTILNLGDNAISFDPHGYRQEYLDLIKNINN